MSIQNTMQSYVDANNYGIVEQGMSVIVLGGIYKWENIES